MSGLAGWAGAVPPSRERGAVLDAMLAGLGAPRATPRRALPGGALGLGANGDGVFEDAGALYAVDGDPVWHEPELATLARQRGHGAALAEAYRCHGAALVERLHGAFTLAVVDAAAGTAFLAIDRMGIGTLCYAPVPGGLVFGTTTDAVRAHPAGPWAISPQALFDYFFFSIIPAPGSVYTGVRKVLPAQSVDFRDGRPTVRAYWSVPYTDAATTDVDALSRDLHQVLDAAVRASMNGTGGTSVGAFLSGGLDSSTVVGLAGEAADGPVPSFTITFDAPDFDEGDYARIAAAHFGSPYHSYAVTDADTVDLLPRLAAAYDEPFGNASAVACYYCAKLAREHGVEVLLAGDGGDEIFAGNARYVMQQVFGFYEKVPKSVRRVLEPVLSGMPGGDRIGVLRRARGYVRRASVPMPERLETYNFLVQNDVSNVLTPEFLERVDADGPLRTVRDVFGRLDDAAPLHRMLHYDRYVTLADNDLRKVGRMCALAGVAVRYPFLDEEVVGFAARIPPDLLIRHLRLRDFYKRAMRGFLPSAVIRKQKHGFGLPFRVWMARPGPLRNLVADVLTAFSERGIVRREVINRLLTHWDDNEARAYGEFFWYMTTLELWLQCRHPGFRI